LARQQNLIAAVAPMCWSPVPVRKSSTCNRFRKYQRPNGGICATMKRKRTRKVILISELSMRWRKTPDYLMSKPDSNWVDASILVTRFALFLNWVNLTKYKYGHLSVHGHFKFHVWISPWHLKKLLQLFNKLWISTPYLHLSETMGWLHQTARHLLMFSLLHLVGPSLCLRCSFDSIQSSTAVLAYDTLLTSSHEVELIWKHRPFFRPGTVLYQMLRYPTLLFFALNLYLDLSNTSIMVRSAATLSKRD
jgi:hypothetical protein